MTAHKQLPLDYTLQLVNVSTCVNSFILCHPRISWFQEMLSDVIKISSSVTFHSLVGASCQVMRDKDSKCGGVLQADHKEKLKASAPSHKRKRKHAVGSSNHKAY
jgi:hypothetical protein